MTVLGRQLVLRLPGILQPLLAHHGNAGIGKVYHTNRKLLRSYRGADGIKTGYTRAAGFNLVASAARGGERVIATVFGGRSTRTRNARVKELLDLGSVRRPHVLRLGGRRALPIWGGLMAARDPGTYGRRVRTADRGRGGKPEAASAPPAGSAEPYRGCGEHREGRERRAIGRSAARRQIVKPAPRPADLVTEATTAARGAEPASLRACPPPGGATGASMSVAMAAATRRARSFWPPR